VGGVGGQKYPEFHKGLRAELVTKGKKKVKASRQMGEKRKGPEERRKLWGIKPSSNKENKRGKERIYTGA